MLIPSVPLSAHHPVTPIPCPPPFPLPLVRFPELGVSHALSPSLIFSLIFSPFPFIPFYYFLYSPNEWDHIMIVLLQMTYFTQHHTLQVHPCGSKWWVFVVSNGWVIFHCVHRPHLLLLFFFFEISFSLKESNDSQKLRSWDAWVAQWLSACLWPRAWSWSPRIESHIGLLAWSLILSLPVSLPLSLSVSLMNKYIKYFLKKIKIPILELLTIALIQCWGYHQITWICSKQMNRGSSTY